jgi:hypothetical protein
MRITTFAELHPHALAFETARRKLTSAPTRRKLPIQSGRVEAPRGVSGTSTTTPANRTAATPKSSQKIAETEACSASTPPASKPTAAPAPAVAMSSPIQTGARPGGARSRAMPMASGPSPAPRPCTARPAIRPPTELARAHQRSGGERRDGEEQQPTLPVHVAEPPKQRDGGDCCEQVRGLEPRGRGERRLVGALNRGQDRKDHELLESQVESTHSQHPRCGAITLDEGTTVHQAQSLIAAGIRRLTFFHIFVRLRE